MGVRGGRFLCLLLAEWEGSYGYKSKARIFVRILKEYAQDSFNIVRGIHSWI